MSTETPPAEEDIAEQKAVRLAKRAQYGIANRVHQNVRVRMAVESLSVRNLDAAKDELSPLNQLVNIVTDTDMIHRGEYKGRKSPTKPFCERESRFPSASRLGWKKDFGGPACSSHHPVA